MKAAKKLLKSSPTATDVSYLIMLHIDGNVDKKFQPYIFYRSRANQFWKIKAAKKLLKNSPTAIDVSYLILLHIDGNIDKKFQTSIFYRGWENHVPPNSLITDRRIDGQTFRNIE